VQLEQRCPCAGMRRNAKCIDVPKTIVWRTLHAQGMKEMVDGANNATEDVLPDCILYAADRNTHSERKVQQTVSVVHSRAERCAAADGGIIEKLLLRAI